MKVKEYLRLCIVNYPTIFENALAVYNHWFATVGNGLEWEDGEIVDENIQEYTDDIPEAVKRVVELYKTPNTTRDTWADIQLKYIKRVLMVDTLINDFSVSCDFYPLSKYSLICNIPDDVKPDWLESAEAFYNIMLENIETVSDKDNLLPSIGERIKLLRESQR